MKKLTLLLCIFCLTQIALSQERYAREIPEMVFQYAGVKRLHGFVGGVQDWRGKEVVSRPFVFCRHYSDGLLYTETTDGLPFSTRHFSFIDEKGNLAFNNIYEDGKKIVGTIDGIGDFYEGLAWFGYQGLFGYIDKKGHMKIPRKYKNAYSFFEGLAAVEDKKGRWGFIDKNGQTVIPFRYTSKFYGFKEGLAAVEDKNGMWGYINHSGIFIIKPQFQSAHWFSDGLAAVEKDGSWGYIDKNGNMVIPNKYSEVWDFEKGLAQVMFGEKWGIIDRNGNEMVPVEYDRNECGISNGIAYITRNNDRKYVYKRRDGNTIYLDDEDTAHFKYAEDGDTLIQMTLASKLLLAGDYKNSAKWYEQAANHGNKNAERLLYYWKIITGEEYQNSVSIVSQNSHFDWLSYQSSTTENQFTLKVGIKSPKQIRKVDVYLNGQLFGETRDMHVAHDDGYDYLINKALLLRDGDNTIEVKVTNTDGVSSDKKTITYSPQPMPIKTSERRFALVIGNGAYIYKTLPPLNNTANDAKDMAAKLNSLGFVVTSVSNANRNQMWDAIDKFMKKVEHSDVALIYYSGHGLSPKGGANYLIPVDAKIDYLDEIDRYCVNSKTALLSKMEKADVKAKIILLDCCNNCNVPERGAKSTSHSGGLSEMKPEGVYILHAAQPGKTADDNGGNGRNSPFVISFLECCEKYSNLSWNDFAPKIITTVKSKTQSRQIPYPEGYIEGQLFLSK